MQLARADLQAFLRLAAPEASEEERAQRLARLRTAVERGERRLTDTRVAKDPAGGLRAALRLAPTGGDTFVLSGPFLADESADAEAAELVGEAMRRARQLGAQFVGSRPDVGRAGPRFRAALLEHGFVELGERVEFKAPVAGLPLDDDTPLRWRQLDDVGEAQAVAMLEAVATGDPHGRTERQSARAALAQWLATPKLTNGPSCVQVGFLEDRAVAFLCAQVCPTDGWSRIAYMGIVPDLRGRGFGTWIHRRGFRVLREQGGRLYHGGTATANAPMLHLFRKHGCQEAARMHEFEWHARPRTVRP